LNVLAQGKNWLEGKWSEQNLVLSEQQRVIEGLQTHIDKLEEDLAFVATFKNGMLYQVARKIGFFRAK
jgi:hypothetical protein